MYTKSLVNTNSLYTNFTNRYFQNVPIPHFNTYFETEIPSLTRISLHFVLTDLVKRILLHMTLSKNQK